MGTSGVFCFKFHFVSCAVVLLSFTGCTFRRHIGEMALKKVQSTSVSLVGVKEDRKKEDVITGTLVRIAHYGEEGEKRNDAFSVLEERYPNTLPLIDTNSPSEKEIDLLQSELIDAGKRIDGLILKAETSLEKVEKDVKILQEKEIKLSQYEMIAFTAGIAILGSLVVQLFLRR
jgi:hypothetical protein